MAAEEHAARSEQGLAILEHAFSEGGKVLQFKNGDEGRRVLDITEHHERLQAFWDQEHDAERN